MPADKFRAIDKVVGCLKPEEYEGRRRPCPAKPRAVVNAGDIDPAAMKLLIPTTRAGIRHELDLGIRVFMSGDDALAARIFENVTQALRRLAGDTNDSLVALWQDWRAFKNAPLPDDADESDCINEELSDKMLDIEVKIAESLTENTVPTFVGRNVHLAFLAFWADEGMPYRVQHTFKRMSERVSTELEKAIKAVGD